MEGRSANADADVETLPGEMVKRRYAPSLSFRATPLQQIKMRRCLSVKYLMYMAEQPAPHPLLSVCTRVRCAYLIHVHCKPMYICRSQQQPCGTACPYILQIPAGSMSVFDARLHRREFVHGSDPIYLDDGYLLPALPSHALGTCIRNPYAPSCPGISRRVLPSRQGGVPGRARISIAPQTSSSQGPYCISPVAPFKRISPGHR